MILQVVVCFQSMLCQADLSFLDKTKGINGPFIVLLERPAEEDGRKREKEQIGRRSCPQLVNIDTRLFQLC